MNIVAECGCNWTSIEEAKEMIMRSKEIGCWGSKFQLFTGYEAPDVPAYLYMSFGQAKELVDYGKSINQRVFFTPMYLEAIDFLESIDIGYYKIRYKDRWNIPLVKKILETNKPYFTSYDLNDFYEYCVPYYYTNIRPLLCVPLYPATFTDYKGIVTFGYSDHTPDFKLLEFAKRHNAIWFEKHVKLEGTEPLENDWSVTFEELREII